MARLNNEAALREARRLLESGFVGQIILHCGGPDHGAGKVETRATVKTADLREDYIREVSGA